MLHSLNDQSNITKDRCFNKFFPIYFFRLEKDKHFYKSEVIKTQQLSDKLLTEKESLEKERKQMTLSMNDLKLQLDEALRNLNDSNTSRQKLSEDRNKIIRKSNENDLLISQLQQHQSNLKKQLSSTLKRVEEETKVLNRYNLISILHNNHFRNDL